MSLLDKAKPSEWDLANKVACKTPITTSPLKTQIGGGHYKSMNIQPLQYSMANNLDACQHSVIKYVSRFRSKGGIEDLKKARHFIDLLIGFETDSK